MRYNKVDIGEMVTLRQGFAINKKTNHYISEVPTHLHLLRIGDMKEQRFSVYVREDMPKKFIAKQDDIIYTRTGQVGLVFRNQHGVIHNNCFTVSSKNEDMLYQPFLYYALQEDSFYHEAIRRATGAAQPDLPHDAFNSIKCYLPPIGSQIKITEILNAYDNLIESNQKQIKLLEEAAQRLYKEWFVDLRFPGYEKVPVVDGVPEGWVVQPLSEIADVIMGQSPRSEFYNQDHIGLPFHQGVSSYGTRFVIDDVYSTSYTRIAEANSILFSVRAPVGRLNITRNRIVIGRGLAALNQKSGYQSYLFYLLKHCYFKDNVIGNGSVFPAISKDELLKQNFLIPTSQLIQTFDSVAERLDWRISALDKQTKLLEQARDRLLPKLMSGELEV